MHTVAVLKGIAEAVGKKFVVVSEVSDEVLHVEGAHSGGFVRDVPEDDDRPPVADIFRTDAVRDIIRRVAAHTESPASPDRHPGTGGTHADWLEGELEGRERAVSGVTWWW